MKNVHFSIIILFFLILFLILYGLYISAGLTELSSLIHKNDMDKNAVRNKWDEIKYALELTVIRTDYDTANESISFVLGDETDDRERRAALERLDHILYRIQESFVPSFFGVF